MWKQIALMFVLALAGCSAENGETVFIALGSTADATAEASPDSGSGNQADNGQTSQDNAAIDTVDVPTEVTVEVQGDVPEQDITADLQNPEDTVEIQNPEDTTVEIQEPDTEKDMSTENPDTFFTLDTGPVVTCDAPLAERLVLNPKVTTLEVFYDKVLDLECSFFETLVGPRCLPLNLSLGTGKKPKIGNPHFLGVAPLCKVGNGIDTECTYSNTVTQYSDATCSNPIFGATFNWKLGQEQPPLPKYGFTISWGPNMQPYLLEAMNLVTPDVLDTFYYWCWNDVQKAFTINYPGAQYGPGCIPNKEMAATIKAKFVYNAQGTCIKNTGTMVSAAPFWAIRYSKELATSPKCPGVFGLNIFATKP